MSLIDDIVRASRKRLDVRKARTPIDELRKKAGDAPRARAGFRASLEARPFSLIAEVKPRSPSGGAMDPSNVEDAVAVYDATPSVAAISILTDADYFDSSPERLAQARPRTSKPLLRKDFIVDEYQVWEARACGADAILLMAVLYREMPSRAVELFELARNLGMDVLFELGMDGDGASRVALPDAPVWGINSRRFQTSALKVRSRIGSAIGTRVFGDLSIDASTHAKLRGLVPEGKLAVAESGIGEPKDLRPLVELRYCAALVGTAFLRKGAKVAETVRAFDEEVAGLLGSAAHVQASPSGPPAAGRLVRPASS
jgi:indole-3-glycerol phosphate synthase